MQEDNQRLANSREDGSHLVQRPFLIPSECIIPTIVIIDKVINNTNAHWSIETDQGIKLYILPKELKSTSIVFQLDNINKSKYKFKKLPFMRADGKSIALDLTEFSSGLLSSNSVKKPLKRSFLLFSIKHSASKFEEGFETCPIDAQSIIFDYFSVELNEEFPAGVKISETIQQVCKASSLSKIFDCFKYQ